MHRKYLGIFLCLLPASFQLLAQNAAPRLANVKANANKQTGTVVIRYDLKDEDDATVLVSIRLLDANGRPAPLPAKLSGDVGTVKPGAHRSILLHYPDFKNLPQYSVQLTADDQHPADIASLVNLVDSNRIRKTLTMVAKKRNYTEDVAQLTLIRSNIEKDFKASGLKTIRQKFTDSLLHGENVFGWKDGRDASAGLYVLTAHFDGVKGSPGADDNASGVAGVMEAMRVLATAAYRHPLGFAGFDLEETGLMGSKAFIASMKGRRIQGAINFDMISFCGRDENSQVFPKELKGFFPVAYKQVSGNSFRGDFILNAMNEPSAAMGTMFDSCANTYVPSLKVVSLLLEDDGKFAGETFRSSDHASFWNAGLPALSIGDTGDARNYSYHSPDDTVDQIDFNFLQNVVKATVATLATLGGMIHGHSVTTSISF